jgi:hypothetical protein
MTHPTDSALWSRSPFRTALVTGLAAVLALGTAACGDGSSGGDTAAQPGDGPADGAAGEAQAAGPRELRTGSSAADAQACMDRISGRLNAVVDSLTADTTGTPSFRRGENPLTAKESGWWPEMPAFMDEVLLPCHRIVVYYGNPLQTRMGVLGEYPKDEMLRRLRDQVAQWEQADPETPVIPGLHMVAIVAQGEPGTSGHYRTIMRDSLIEATHQWARRRAASSSSTSRRGRTTSATCCRGWRSTCWSPTCTWGSTPSS